MARIFSGVLLTACTIYTSSVRHFDPSKARAGLGTRGAGERLNGSGGQRPSILRIWCVQCPSLEIHRRHLELLSV